MDGRSFDKLRTNGNIENEKALVRPALSLSKG